MKNEPELLDEEKIRSFLGPDCKRLVRRLDVFERIGSTNTWLMQRASEPDFHASVCLAEQQTAGRGRRGRSWISPFGRNIALSIGWEVAAAPAGISGLSLVVGMAVVQALRDVGLGGAGLKWPNDVLLDGGKLAGILVEIASARAHRVRVVTGVGVNLHLSGADARQIDQAASQIAGRISVGRNRLAADLITAIFAAIQRFETEGFDAASAWHEYDVLLGRPVTVRLADESVSGIDRGIDETGNLLLETADGMRSFNAGEVSLRPEPA